MQFFQDQKFSVTFAGGSCSLAQRTRICDAMVVLLRAERCTGDPFHGDLCFQPSSQDVRQTALLSGARFFVRHFNWVERMILRILVSGLRVLCSTFIDGYPTMGTDTERVQLTSCVEALLETT